MEMVEVEARGPDLITWDVARRLVRGYNYAQNTLQWKHPQVNSHCDLRELLLGEVQRVVDGRDAELHGFGVWREEGPQDGVVGHVHEGHDGVPAFVVVPDLREES